MARLLLGLARILLVAILVWLSSTCLRSPSAVLRLLRKALVVPIVDVFWVVVAVSSGTIPTMRLVILLLMPLKVIIVAPFLLLTLATTVAIATAHHLALLLLHSAAATAAVVKPLVVSLREVFTLSLHWSCCVWLLLGCCLHLARS